MGRPCSSKKLRRDGEWGDAEVIMDQNEDTGTRKDAEQVATKESDLPIEILSTIFEHLDFQSLKQVRFACKRWHQAAEFHFKTRGIVSLYVQKHDCTSSIEEFLTMREQNIQRSGVLPEPFKDIDVDLGRVPSPLPSEQHLNKLILSSSLALTRFTPWRLPLKLTLPLLLKASSTLEYLKLDAASPEEGYEPPKDPPQIFPKLLTVALVHSSVPGRATGWTHFPLIVAWVVNGSPNLQTYHSYLYGEDPEVSQEFESEILLQLDLQTVKTLRLSLEGLNEGALEHLLATPFSRLQTLNLFSSPSSLVAVVVGIAKTTRDTLKKLNLFGLLNIGVFPLALSGFPLSPNIKELTLFRFPDKERYSESLQFLSRQLPGLQVLNIRQFLVRDGFDWSSVSPFLDVKTLKIWDVSRDYEGLGQLPGDLLFLQKFPALETLYVHPLALVESCALKASGDPQYLELLKGVKHLGLEDHYTNWSVVYSLLYVLKGIETITFVESSPSILTVPVRDMPCLKLLRFPWGRNLKSKQLMELAKGVERVVVSNCCSFPEAVNWKTNLLKKFLDSSPNAECGCKEWERRSDPW